MTRKIKLLRRVRDVRKKLRDAAAGEVAMADARTARANEDLRAAQQDLQDMHDGTARRYQAATSVQVFLDVELHRQILRGNIAAANVQHSQAAKEARHLRNELLSRSHDLKKADKIFDAEKGRVAVDQLRREQRASDDRESVKRKDKEDGR